MRRDNEDEDDDEGKGKAGEAAGGENERMASSRQTVGIHDDKEATYRFRLRKHAPQACLVFGVLLADRPVADEGLARQLRHLRQTLRAQLGVVLGQLSSAASAADREWHEGALTYEAFETINGNEGLGLMRRVKARASDV